MHASSLPAGGASALPSKPALVEYALRQLAAALVVAAAAYLVHRAGLQQHMWPYVVMAGAIVPQVLLAVVALGDEERRARLRGVARPAPVPALIAVGLALTAVGGWLADQPLIGIGAAVVAAIGVGVSALPTHVHVPGRSPR